MGITTRFIFFSGKSIGGFLLVQAGSSLCSLRSAVRPSSFRGEGGHTPLAIFSYSEEGKVMLDVLKMKEMMPLEHATLLPVSFPGKLVVKF